MSSLLRFGLSAPRLSAAPLPFLPLAAAALLLAIGAAAADAQTIYTWDPGSSTSGATDGNANWSTSGAGNNVWLTVSPTDQQFWANSTSTPNNAVFGAGGTGSYTVTLGTNPIDVGTMTFNSMGAGGNYTISTSTSDTLNIYGGITLNSGAGPVTISSSSGTGINLEANNTWTNNSANLLTVSSNVAGSTFNLTFAGSGNTTLSGGFSGSGALTMNGSGTLTLSNTGSNFSFSGNTTINSGALVLAGNGNTLPSTKVTVNPGGVFQYASSISNSTTTVQPNTQNVTLAGGEFSQVGSTSTSLTVKVPINFITNGQSTFTVIGAAGHPTQETIVVNNSTLNSNNGMVLLRGTNLGTGLTINGSGGTVTNGAGYINYTGGSANAQGTGNNNMSLRIIPYAIGDTTATGAGSTFVTTNGDTQSIPLPLNNTFYQTSLSAADANQDNVWISGGVQSISSSPPQINSLLIGSGGGITNTGTPSISVRSAILFTASGSIGASGSGLSIATTGNGATTFISAVPGITGTIYAAILDNSGSAVAIGGGGTIALNGANTYVNGTFIEYGTLQVSSPFPSGAIGPLGNSSATISIANGTLQYVGAGSATLNNRSITLIGANGALDASGTTTASSQEIISGAIAAVNGGNTATTPILTLTGTGFGKITGTISNGGASGVALSVVKTGNGTWTLANASSNSYSGSTTINNGILNINGDAALGATTNTVAFGGGTLQWNGNFALASTRSIVLNSGGGIIDLNGSTGSSGKFVQGNVSGAGGLTVVDSTNGGKTMLLASAEALSYSGSTTIGTATANSGTLKIAASNQLPNTPLILNAGGTFDLNGAFNQAVSSLSGSGFVTDNTPSLTPTLTIGSDNTSTVFSGNIYSAGTGSDAVGLTKVGTGSLTLSGASNLFGGAVTISGGKIIAGRANVLGNGASASNVLTVTNVGNTLDLAGFSESVQALAGNGTIDSSSGNGVLVIQQSSATLTTFAGAIQNSGIGATTALTYSGQAGHSLTLTGTNNSYSGPTTINNGGSIIAGAANCFSPNSQVVLPSPSPGKLDLHGWSEMIGSLVGVSGSNVVSATSGPYTLTLGNDNSPTATFAGTISNSNGTLGVTKTGAGTQIFSGPNTYTGPTNVNQGTLDIASGGSLASATAVAINVNNGGTLQVASGGSISSTGAVADSGTLFGSGTINGTLTINSGGVLQPGDGPGPGTIATAATTYKGGGNFNLSINNAMGTAGTNWSQQSLGANVLTLDSTITSSAKFNTNLTGLTSSNVAGAVPRFNQNTAATWTFANSSSSAISGTFTAANFSVTTTNFTNNNSIGNGSFSVATANSSKALAVIFTPNTLGVIATDSANNYTSWSSPTTSVSPNPGGFALGAWTLNNNGNSAQSGQFLGSSSEIDVNGKSWGLYANNGGSNSPVSEAIRAINNNLQVGHTLAFDFDNKSINSGGSVGISLRNGSTNLFEFLFGGGNSDYSITDSKGTLQLNNAGSWAGTPALPFTNTGLHLEFTLTTPTSYSLAVTAAAGGAVSTYTGTLANSGSTPINTFRAFNFIAGSSNNLYVNSTNILLPTWNGLGVGASGGNFSTVANWAAHAPLNGGSIALDGTGWTVTNDAGASGITSLYNISFNGTIIGQAENNTTNAGTYTLQSSGLTSAGLTLGGGITNGSTNPQNINFTGSGSVGITLGASQTFDAGSGGLSFGASTGIDLHGNTLTVQGSANTTVAAAIINSTGTGALTKLGSATLNLNATATYNGTTTIGANPSSPGGTIKLGVADALPTAGALVFNGGSTTPSTLDLNGNNQTVASLFDGGTTSGAITNSSSTPATFTLNNSGSNFFYGPLSGANLTFVRTGAGTEELGGASTLGGGVMVKAGTIVVGASTGALSGPLGLSGGAVTLGDIGGTANASILIGRAGGAPGPGATGGLTLANNITVQDGNSGTLTLGGQNTSGTNTFSGNITLGAMSNVAKDVTLNAAAGGEVDFTGNLLANGSSAANVTIGNASLASNTGTIKFQGTNTYTGATNINLGRLILGGGASLATSSLNIGSGATLSAFAPSSGMNGGASLTVGASSTFDMVDNNVGVLNLTGAGTALTIGGASGTAPTMTFEIGAGSSGTDRIALTAGNSAATLLATSGKVNVNAVSGVTTIYHGIDPLITTNSPFPPGLTFSNGSTSATMNLGANRPTYNLSLAASGNNEVLNVIVATPTNAYWSGSVDGSWSSLGAADATNWRTDATSGIDTQQVPSTTGAATNVFFTVTSGAMNLTNNALDGSYSIAGLTFTPGSGSVTIASGTGVNTLSIGAGGIGNSSGTAQNVSVNLAMSAAQSYVNNGAGLLSIGTASTTLSNGGARLTVTGTGSTTISSLISGAGDLLKQGTGTLTLSGANSFSPAGATNVFLDQGTLRLADSAAAGSTVNGGTIAVGSSSLAGLSAAVSISTAGVNVPNPIDARYFNNIGGTGGLTGAETVGGANTTGTATYSGGITLHNNLTLSAASGGTVVISGAIVTGAASGGQTLNAAPPASGASTGFGTGPGIVIVGPGVVEFDGVNTFGAANNGDTVLTSGSTLQFANGGSANNSALRLYGNATVNIADSATNVGSVINPQSAVAGVKTISATNASGTANYSGGIFLDDNATVLSTNSGATVAFSANTFDLKNHLLTVSGAGNVRIDDAITNSTAGGQVTMSGTGTLALSNGSNSYSGGTTVSGGTLRVTNSTGSATGTGDVTLDSGATLVSGPVGSIGGTVRAGTGMTAGPHSIAPGGGGSIGALTVGGLNLSANTTLNFDIASTSSLDALTDSGALAVSSGQVNVAVPTGLANGRYKLIGYSSTSLADASGFQINGGAAPTGYSLNLNTAMSELDLIVSSGNASLLSLSPSHLLVRSMINGSQSGMVTLTENSGTSAATYSAAPTNEVMATAPTASVPAGGTTNVAIGFSDYSMTGPRSGMVTFNNTANMSDTFNGSGNMFTLDAGSAVVDNRLVSATSVDLGVVHVGGTGSGSTTLSTSGDNDHFTAVTVAGTLYNSDGQTGSASINPVLHMAGAITNGSVTLATAGEGLTGENPINVSVPYVAQVFSGLMAWKPANASGSWATDVNWTDTASAATAGAPGLSGALSVANDTATFDNAMAATLVILDNASPHVKAVTFGAANGGNAYTIAQGVGTGVLHLDNGAGVAAITANSDGHAITVPITLDSNTTVTVTNLAGLTISGSIGGTSRTLTKLGAGTLTLGATSSYSGGTTVTAGTLRTNPGVNGALGGGDLNVSATDNTASALSLGGNETVTSLSGTVTATNSSATISVAAGKTLTVNQSTNTVYQGTVDLTGKLATTGSGTLELQGAPTLGPGTVLSVGNTGTLRFNIVSGTASVSSASAVIATVGGSATLELDGMVSALGDGTGHINRTRISNDGAVIIGNTIVTPETNQQVGGIDGVGSVTVSDGARLTADHINQTSLVIGDGSVFTLAPSDENGDPMVALAAGESPAGRASGFVLGGSLLPSTTLLSSGGGLLVVSSPTAGAATVSLGGGIDGGPVSAVPEPASLWLFLLGAMIVWPIVRRRG